MTNTRPTTAGWSGPGPAPSPDARASATVRVWLLGRFEVSVGPRVIREDGWRLRKAASLVKLLVLAPGHRLHREQLLELLWPDLKPASAANNLHQTVHVVRRTLEPGSSSPRLLQLRDGHLTLCPRGSLWSDVEAFEQAAREARSARDPALYRTALDLYAGELLPGDRYEDWTEGRREELRRTHLALLVELAALYEERGDHGPAIEKLQKVVSIDPTHEEAHAGLMRSYAGVGQRHRALRQYESLENALRHEFGTEPDPSTRDLRERLLSGDSLSGGPRPANPRPTALPGAHNNLPGSLTSFVGRGREKAEIEDLLGAARLLTLTGPGGAGKTRLALQVSGGLTPTYPDGTWLVELAPLAEGALVAHAVAAALGVREQPDRPLLEALTEDLREKSLLLVLDNCEHLVDAAARLAESLLASCPGLRILATSRESLGVPGEVVFSVPPLSGPDRWHRVEDLEGYEAVQLFVERARYGNPAFVLTERNAPAVTEICRRLDGIPLAIELAAARVGLSLEELAERLDDSLRLLNRGSRTAPPRQRTLRGALDWSYELLSAPERTLFARLSVFAGGWALDAAETVCSGAGIAEEDVLDLVSGLVDKSLVAAVATEEGSVRYRMLEPIRQYARGKLEEGGEADAVRREHARWCLAFAEGTEKGLEGPDQASLVERLERERPNAHAALAWSLEVEPETALRLAATLGKFWYRYGHTLEGRRWLEAVLEKTAGLQTADRARALRLAGILSEESGLYDRAGEFHDEGLALYRRLEDKKGVAYSLTSLGALAYALGDVDRAAALTEESISLKRELGDEKALMSSLNNLGEILQTAGDLPEAQALFEEILQKSREWGEEWGAAISRLNLGTLAVEQDDPLRAEELLREALISLHKLGDLDGAAECLDSLAGVAGARGHGERAAALLGAAEAARERLGTPIRPVERDRYERFAALSRRTLDTESWESARAAGRALSLDEAARYALTTEAPAEPRDGLTRREREVATLLAQGLTNRRISEELFISERTVATHVGRILKKVGLRSRAQIATWMAESRQRAQVQDRETREPR